MNTIYGIKNNKSGKIVYVGCTNNFWSRLSKHRDRTTNTNDPSYTQPLYQAIRAKGFSYFGVVQIAQVKDRVEALKLEAKMIKELQPQFNKHHKKVK